LYEEGEEDTRRQADEIEATTLVRSAEDTAATTTVDNTDISAIVAD
jgi:hypothetical protein